MHNILSAGRKKNNPEVKFPKSLEDWKRFGFENESALQNESALPK